MSLKFKEKKAIYNITNIRPFLILCKTEDIKKNFLNEYNNKSSFRFYESRERAKIQQKIFTESFVFTVEPYVDKKNNDKVIGINIWGCHAIKQSQTLESVRCGIQIIGWNMRNCYALGEKQDPKVNYDGAIEFWDGILKLQQERYDELKGRTGANIDKNENQLEFLNEQIEIVREQKQYESKKSFTIEYSAYGDIIQNQQEGVKYKFILDGSINDERIKKMVESKANVEVSVNDGGKGKIGKVVDYQDDYLIIKFQGNEISSNRIAKSGEIKETGNVEYDIKLNTFDRLLRGVSANVYLTDVVVDGEVRSYVEKIKYENTEDSSGNKLNPSQKEAVKKALNVEDFLLVQGPPGTGKTTIITEMIMNFVKQGLRVLICSKNNLAVDNVLEKCRNLYYDEQKCQKIQCLRLGNEEKVLDSVKGNLQRPLALDIQNNVKLMSQEARERYWRETEERKEKYIHAERVTKTICTSLRKAIEIQKEYKDILDAVYSSRLAFIFGKKKKARMINYSIQMQEIIGGYINELIALLRTSKIDIKNNKAEEFRNYLEQITMLILCIKAEILSYTLRYKFVFGKNIDNIINGLFNSKEQMDVLYGKMVEIEGYEGNPIAEEVISLRKENNELNNEILEKYEKEVADIINVAKSKLGILQNTLDEWHEALENDDEGVEKPLLQTVKIIGATCIGTCTNPNFKNTVYDVAIVDEAGQIALHDVVVPLEKAKKIILIGDHMQLPPMGDDDLCNYFESEKLLGFEMLEGREKNEYKQKIKKLFSESLFEKLYKNERTAGNRVMLNMQFRMHPDIAEFISMRFYNGEYKSGVEAKDRYLKIANFDKPMYFIDTKYLKCKYEINPKKEIHINRCEAYICAVYLTRIIKAIINNNYEMSGGKGKLISKDDGKFDIGVITAYKAQIPELKKCIRMKLKQDKNFSEEFVNDIMARITINTLDSFQGRDNQIIFYSFVRSNRIELANSKDNKKKNKYSIGFQNEVRRLNVMMTRAKSLLVMIGDSETLEGTDAMVVHSSEKASDYYKDLVDYCKKKSGYIDYAKEPRDE